MASILHSPTGPERLAPADGRGLWLAVGAAIGAAWLYLIAMAWGMANMGAAAGWLLMPRMMHWGATDLLLVFVMWAVMMAAMMLPSALPLLALLRRIDCAGPQAPSAGRRTARFAAGYLAVWTVYGGLATLAQWGLLELRLVSPMMQSSSTYLSAALLLVAGAYQLSPFKNACLRQCRSPLGFILNHRSEDRFLLGLRHGSYCAGCCALLMALLFVLGVMNLLWILALTVTVLLEKLLPDARWFSRLTGVTLLLWGVGLLAVGPW